MVQQKPSEQHFYCDMPGVREAYIHTNFGPCHPDWIHKGLEWGAIKHIGKDYDYAVCIADRGLKLDVFQAYLEYMRRDPMWYKELKVMEEYHIFKELTNLPTAIPAEYLEHLRIRSLALIDQL